MDADGLGFCAGAGAGSVASSVPKLAGAKVGAITNESADNVASRSAPTINVSNSSRHSATLRLRQAEAASVNHGDESADAWHCALRRGVRALQCGRAVLVEA